MSRIFNKPMPITLFGARHSRPESLRRRIASITANAKCKSHVFGTRSSIIRSAPGLLDRVLAAPLELSHFNR